MPTKRPEPETHRVPCVKHDYRSDPTPYPALKTEQGVFTTPPYSGEIKHLWRFKDEQSAKISAQHIWQKWQEYKREADFVGMDTARKFIQMGRTRSLRYALRPGGRKYEYVSDDDGDTHAGSGDGGARRVAMKRTGKVYDEEKLKGANVFEEYLDRCWADEVYRDAWERWKKGERDVLPKTAKDEPLEPSESVASPPKKRRKASAESHPMRTKQTTEEEVGDQTTAPRSSDRKRKRANA